MANNVDETLARMVARGGRPFHEIPARGPITLMMRLLGLPTKTHYYERLDGKRILLTEEEVSGIAPIELELFSLRAARGLMLDRRKHAAK